MHLLFQYNIIPTNLKDQGIRPNGDLYKRIMIIIMIISYLIKKHPSKSYRLQNTK